MPRNIRDAALVFTRALPNGAATVYSATPLNLELTSRADFIVGHDLIIEAPACNTTQLPDTQTLKYSIEHDSDPAFGSAVALYPDVLTQTGASGAGCAAVSKRVALPSDVKSYVRLKIVKSGAGDASAAIAQFALLF